LEFKAITSIAPVKYYNIISPIKFHWGRKMTGGDGALNEFHDQKGEGP